MDMLVEIFTTSLTPIVFLYMLVGVVAGICIGALPGLTATMGVALLLPMTFGMEAAQGILMLLGIYVGAIYGGSISAVLLHTPGTPASAATAIEGYKLNQRGEAGRALGVATLSSYIGGVVSVLCLWLISPQLAKLALKFSSAEFFLLAMFGLCIIGNISGNSVEKGLMCGCLGILVATVGIDSVTSYIRFCPEGNYNFMGGISYIPIMIGALTIQGLTPGPMLFETNKVLVYTIFMGMFVANTLMCICGFAGIRVFSKVLSVPKVILTPIIFALCIIGSFAMKNSLFDVWVMLIAGVVGYFLGKAKVPTSPAILGLILGPMAEKNFRTALLKSGGDPTVFFSTVICWFFIILIVGTRFGPTIKNAASKVFKKKAS